MKHTASVLVLLILFLMISIFYLLSNDLAADFLVSITAVIGAIAIWFEIKRGKEIAEGEFVITLNNSYQMSPDIKTIYKKIVEGEKILEDDRAAVVEYLTFFETLYILVSREVINLSLINDLFAYRFFSAVNNKDIQNMELVKDARYYKNIYRLDNLWHRYRYEQGSETDRKSELQKIVPDYEDLIK